MDPRGRERWGSGVHVQVKQENNTVSISAMEVAARYLSDIDPIALAEGTVSKMARDIDLSDFERDLVSHATLEVYSSIVGGMTIAIKSM
jgi:hypothetical protein